MVRLPVEKKVLHNWRVYQIKENDDSLSYKKNASDESLPIESRYLFHLDFFPLDSEDKYTQGRVRHSDF